MNLTLLKALGATVPICILFFGAVVLFFRRRTLSSALQLLGAGCLVIVILAHFCEALDLFPWMHWGDEHSVGHYPRPRECCSWSDFVSSRVFASCAFQAMVTTQMMSILRLVGLAGFRRVDFRSYREPPKFSPSQEIPFLFIVKFRAP